MELDPRELPKIDEKDQHIVYSCDAYSSYIKMITELSEDIRNGKEFYYLDENIEKDSDIEKSLIAILNQEFVSSLNTLENYIKTRLYHIGFILKPEDYYILINNVSYLSEDKTFVKDSKETRKQQIKTIMYAKGVSLVCSHHLPMPYDITVTKTLREDSEPRITHYLTYR
jgi:hypothetical protein